MFFQKQTKKTKSNWTGQRMQGGAERAFVKAGKRVEEAWNCVKEHKKTKTKQVCKAIVEANL